jgi:hypothetical protein
MDLTFNARLNIILGSNIGGVDLTADLVLKDLRPAVFKKTSSLNVVIIPYRFPPLLWPPMPPHWQQLFRFKSLRLTELSQFYSV